MFFFDPTILILIPGILLTFIAQQMINSAYQKYSKVPTKKGITGAQAASMIMQSNGLNDVRISQINGQLTDNYDPRSREMHLSVPVASGASIASVGIAAHETGHALQHQQGYLPLKFRNFIVPVSNFCSMAAWPLFFIGLIFGYQGFGTWLMDIGIILFCVSLVFYLITLPVELNASNRAVKELSSTGLLEEDEMQGVKKVLRAAALTYVASLFTAVLTLARLLVLRNRR